MFKKDKSIDVSLPKEIMIHGMLVKKVSIGKYIKAMKGLEELPGLLITELFGEGDIISSLDTLSKMSKSDLLNLVGKLVLVMPEHLISLICEIIDIEKEEIVSAEGW